MQLLQNVSLAHHSTMRLGGTTAYACDIHDTHELEEALTWAEEKKLPVIMIGVGSNIVWREGTFPGLLLINKILGYEATTIDDTHTSLTIGAGENWDSIVARSVESGLTGIECLSLIPGTAGATPIQNVGAYGQDISQTLTSVEVYDTQLHGFTTLSNEACHFAYRSSLFKATGHGRFFITAITLHLTKANPEAPFYTSLQKYLDNHNIHRFTPSVIRDAVIAVRQQRLPDPAIVANNGSFFANPLITMQEFAKLQASYPNIPHWEQDGGLIKIPAAWLVESAGLKDFHDDETGMATWPAQALVMINEHADTTNDLLLFKQKIVQTVQEKFGITLVQEPELLP